jgi:hypothetical protein
MSQSKATTDHEAIRRWVEERKGHPACVRSTDRGDSCVLRIGFDRTEKALEAISWDEFFETFDKNELVFLYQDKTAAGRKSRFNKLVKRDSVDDARRGGAAHGRASAGGGASPGARARGGDGQQPIERAATGSAEKRRATEEEIEELEEEEVEEEEEEEEEGEDDAGTAEDDDIDIEDEGDEDEDEDENEDDRPQRR